MPRPSISDSAILLETAAASGDVDIVIGANTNAVVIMFGGYGGTAVTVSSVQLDPTGTPRDVDDVELYRQNGTDQYAGLYVMYDTHTYWPGTGTHTFRVTLDAAGRQLKVAGMAVDDVDTGGTPSNGTNTGISGSGTPSLSLVSSSNALNLGSAATYSADVGSPAGDDTMIEEDQNGGSSSSLYCWSEDGASSSDTIEANQSVAYAMCAISLEGTSSGLSVTPTGIASDEAFGSTTVSPGAVSITPNGISSDEAFGSAVISSIFAITPSGIASAETVGNPTLSVGSVTVIPSGIVSAEAFGTAALSQGLVIAPASIETLEAFGNPTLMPGTVTVLPTGIESDEAFGVAQVGDVIIAGKYSVVVKVTTLIAQKVTSGIGNDG